MYSSFVLFLFCFYLYNVNIKEFTFDKLDKPILQVNKKREYKCRNTRTNTFFDCFLNVIAHICIFKISQDPGDKLQMGFKSIMRTDQLVSE